MITLRDRLEEYLMMRRLLGFQLNDVERQVGLFCTWLEGRGYEVCQGSGTVG